MLVTSARLVTQSSLDKKDGGNFPHIDLIISHPKITKIPINSLLSLKAYQCRCLQRNWQEGAGAGDESLGAKKEMAMPWLAFSPF